MYTYSLAVYLYGYAASADYRRSVPQIREGEYEKLEEKVRVALVSLDHFSRPLDFCTVLVSDGFAALLHW